MSKQFERKLKKDVLIVTSKRVLFDMQNLEKGMRDSGCVEEADYLKEAFETGIKPCIVNFVRRRTLQNVRTLVAKQAEQRKKQRG